MPTPGHCEERSDDASPVRQSPEVASRGSRRPRNDARPHFARLRGPAVIVLPLLLTACGAFDRTAPDEFAVTTRAPLVIPSDFSLPPPRPGIERAPEQSPRLQAEAALVPELVLTGGNGPDSPGQQALLKAAGPPAPPNIRQLVEQEVRKDSGAGVADALLFWKAPPPPGTAVNPAKEAARLRQQGAAAVPAAASPISQP